MIEFITHVEPKCRTTKVPTVRGQTGGILLLMAGKRDCGKVKKCIVNPRTHVQGGGTGRNKPTVR